MGLKISSASLRPSQNRGMDFQSSLYVYPVLKRVPIVIRLINSDL